MSQIKATVIEHSTCAQGIDIATLEWEYPRFIHSEVMTHRVLSRNAASSRAIPAQKMRAQVWNSPALPIYWGRNQSGMQAGSSLTSWRYSIASNIWKAAGKLACALHLGLEKVGLHKQITNRILEPWQIMKVVVTSTEWANFMWLRDHKDAQPEIAELAKQTRIALEASTPTFLNPGQWHCPYADDIIGRRDPAQARLAKAVSVSCCAQVSYNRELNDTPERAEKIYNMLVDGQRVHASPFEHQATPIGEGTDDGLTHFDLEGTAWSGNFKGWVQHRQLVKGHVKW